MATTQIKIIAEVQQATRAIDQLKGKLDNVGSSVNNTEKSMKGLTEATDFAATAAKALAAAIGVREIVNYSNSWTDLNSRVLNATGSQQEAEKALKAITETARRTYQPIQQVADVFLQNNLVLKDLGYTTNEQIKLNALLNNTLAVSGSRGEKAASSLAAFGRAVAEGKVNTETLNSLLNNNPRLVQAMADALGVGITELREMARAGKLETGPMLDRLTTQMQKVQQEADAMPAHVGDAMKLIDNALLTFIGSLDQTLGASQKVADGLIYLADNIDIVVKSATVFFSVLAVGKFIAMASAIRKTATAVGVLNAALTVVGKNPLVKLLALIAGGATFVGMKLFADGEEEKADKIKTAAEQEADARKDSAAQAERQARQAKIITEEQKKLIQAYEGTLSKLRENVVHQQEILTVGQEEANIRKVIRQEQEKYAGASASTLRTLLEQENSLKEQIKLKEQLNSTDEELQKIREQQSIAAGFSFTELLELDKKIAQARKNIAQATTDETVKQATSQLDAYKEAYERQFEDLMIAHSREMTAIQQHIKKINQIDALLFEGKIARYNEEHIAFKMLNQEKLMLESELQSKMLSLNEDRIRRGLQLERRAVAQILSLKDRETLQTLGKEERHKAIVEERINFEKRSETEKVAFAIDQGAQMFSALGAQNKKAFEAAKAFNLANAIMNTYMAATKALATFPPPFNFIAAAAAVGMGLAQVAQIRSQQYSGRRVGGPVVGGKGYMVGESGPEIFTPGTSGSITKNSDIGTGMVNVNFTINAVDSAGVDALLVQRRGLITQIINDAMVERGQRGI